jgi:hypothetical protein
MDKPWLDYILAHPEKEWDWASISSNSAITWDDIVAHPECPWNWIFMPLNPNITWDIIINNLDKPWGFYALSQHPGLDIEFVLANPLLEWDWDQISQHSNVTWDIVKANKTWNHPDKTKRLVPWKFCGLSINHNITMDIVEKNIKQTWSFPYLSSNPNLTWEFVEKYSDKEWNWTEIAQSKIVTWEIVKRYPHLPWNNNTCSRGAASALSRNPNITWDIILEDLKGGKLIPWCTVGVCHNPNITIDIVKKNRWFQWNMYSLSSNPNINWNIIYENPDIFPPPQNGCYHPHINIDLNEYTWEDWLATSDRDKRDIYYLIYECPNINWTILESCKMFIWKNSLLDYNYTWKHRGFSGNPMTEPVRKRIQARCRKLKEELIAGVMNPKRILYLIENYGIDAVEQF